MTTTIEYIKQLREITGAGILECRMALESSNYIYEAALIELKERAAAKAAGKSERETLQGTVEVYAHNGGRIGVMLEVNCETDFTARSDRFRDTGPRARSADRRRIPAVGGGCGYPRSGVGSGA